MGRPELGTKCTCTSCKERFYDLNRTPAVCPKCGAEQPPEVVLARRTARPAFDTKRFSRAPEPVAAEEEEVAAAAEDTDVEDAEDLPDDSEDDLEIDPAHDKTPE